MKVLHWKQFSFKIPHVILQKCFEGLQVLFRRLVFQKLFSFRDHLLRLCHNSTDFWTEVVLLLFKQSLVTCLVSLLLPLFYNYKWLWVSEIRKGTIFLLIGSGWMSYYIPWILALLCFVDFSVELFTAFPDHHSLYLKSSCFIQRRFWCFIAITLAHKDRAFYRLELHFSSTLGS